MTKQSEMYLYWFDILISINKGNKGRQKFIKNWEWETRYLAIYFKWKQNIYGLNLEGT
jgi:hypothetical protein